MSKATTTSSDSTQIAHSENKITPSSSGSISNSTSCPISEKNPETKTEHRATLIRNTETRRIFFTTNFSSPVRKTLIPETKTETFLGSPNIPKGAIIAKPIKQEGPLNLDKIDTFVYQNADDPLRNNKICMAIPIYREGKATNFYLEKFATHALFILTKKVFFILLEV